MVTIFALPKAFHGHTAVIQHNAIASWCALDASVEVILFGADFGVEAAASAHGALHRSEVQVNDHGTPLLGPVFAEAQRIASWPTLVYANADIIFLPDLIHAVSRLKTLPEYLLCGQRIDLDVREPLEFGPRGAANAFLEAVASNGRLHGPTGSDYFVFRQGTLEIPPFSVGRPGWDNWLIFHARACYVLSLVLNGKICHKEGCRSVFLLPAALGIRAM